MKKLFIFLFFFNFSFLHGSEIKFEKIISGLDKPWSLSFINQENIILTEKSGNLFTLNLKDKKKSQIKHDLLFILEDGQGGLLDVLFHEGEIYLSYSEYRGMRGYTSTSVAKGSFDKQNIKFKTIFRAEPPIDSGYHFG